ncbi:MAG: tetratricopeptide repeat protein [Euryarchaeota archaeon]|nr:tetratricopeptide repeat protein [Euryarchaeota archaeon]
MEAPPSIRKVSRRESMDDLLFTLKHVRAVKAANAGMEHLGKDDWPRALDGFREAEELFDELGDRVQRSNMLSMQGLCLFALDKLDEAAEVMRRAIDLKDGLQSEDKANDLLGYGEILLKKGDLDGALAAFEESVVVLEGKGHEQELESAKIAAAKVKKLLDQRH